MLLFLSLSHTLAQRCEHSMIRLRMFLPLQLCRLTSGQHSPELLRLILRFILLVTLSIVNFHPGPPVLGWFDRCKLRCDIASSHICIVQVAFAVEPDALATTTPDYVLGKNCSNFQSNKSVSFQQDSSIFEEKRVPSFGDLRSTQQRFGNFRDVSSKYPLCSTLVRRLHFDLAQIWNDCPSGDSKLTACLQWQISSDRNRQCRHGCTTVVIQPQPLFA